MDELLFNDSQIVLELFFKLILCSMILKLLQHVFFQLRTWVTLCHVQNMVFTTRKTLIGVSMLVVDCFGAALLLRFAA
jgi:hypothetical protein